MKKLRRIRNFAGLRLVISFVIGLAVALVLLLMKVELVTSLLLGWDAMILVFIVWVWIIIWPMDHKQTARYALREDPTRGAADAILLFASLASIGAVIFILLNVGSQNGGEQTLDALTGIGSVVLSWLLIHTVYTLRYAGMFYSPDTEGSVDFNGDRKPSYADFAYLAFTLGMTYQVSDTDLTGTAFRKAVLKHTLLSYVFGTLIIATTINLVAGLGQG